MPARSPHRLIFALKQLLPNIRENSIHSVLKSKMENPSLKLTSRVRMVTAGRLSATPRPARLTGLNAKPGKTQQNLNPRQKFHRMPPRKSLRSEEHTLNS